MREHDSASAPKIAIPAILAHATKGATEKRKRAERLAALLADLMAEMHGGEWRVQIEHEPNVAMVVVAPKPDRRARPMMECS